MTSSSKAKSYFSSLFLLLLNSLLNKPINIFTSIVFFSLLLFFFVYFIYNLFRCQCGLSYTAHSTASFQRMKGAHGSSSHRWWWPVFCLSHPDILTRLLASTKKAQLEWTQLNFLRFTSLQKNKFYSSAGINIPVHGAWNRKCQIGLLFGLYWIIWFGFVDSEVLYIFP